MRFQTIFFSALGALALGVLNVSCSSGLATSGTELALVHTDATSVPESGSDLESEIVRRINRYRVSQGKGPLARHPGLDGLSRAHSGAMHQAGKMSHKNYHRRAHVAERGHRLENLSENVVWGRGVPTSQLGEFIVRSWIESPAHRHNLLYPNEYIGVAVTRGADGRFYGTQLSARPSRNRSVQPGGPMAFR